ncbi:MAG: glycosyltransferase family 2 protein [Desulfobacteraceae bacterium]|nr:MAG: glycosyltransferase family 2 protein [Desulfobacteraceae bacterium]
MDISVLICTWNNFRRLAITLESFCGCRIPASAAWELIVVANHCTDRTGEIVSGMMNRLPLVYVEEPVQGLSRAKNTGLRKVSGNLVIFTDDDVCPDSGWIEAYWNSFRLRPRGFFWGGPVESEFEGEKPDADLLSVAPHSVKGMDLGPVQRYLRKGECFISANWSCARDALLQVGGFDENLGLNSRRGEISTGEESDIMSRLVQAGNRAVYLPTAGLKHFVPQSKCSFEHILERCLAGARSSAGSFEYRLKWLDRGAVKWGLALHIFKKWLCLQAARICGRSAVGAYVDLRMWREVHQSLNRERS